MRFQTRRVATGIVSGEQVTPSLCTLGWKQLESSTNHIAGYELGWRGGRKLVV
jgi:hypothetical protein